MAISRRALAPFFLDTSARLQFGIWEAPVQAGPTDPSIIPTPPPPPGPINVTQTILVPGTYVLEAGQYVYGQGSHVFGFQTDTAELDVRGTLYIEMVEPDYGNILMATYGLLDHVRNTGVIVADAHGAFPSGVDLFGGILSLNNSGQIFALSENGSARAVFIYQSWNSGVTNDGLIAARSGLTGQIAMGFHTTAVDLWNGVWIHNKSNGVILAEGWVATAVKVEMYADGKPYTLVNEGRIEARSLPGGEPSVGVQAYGGAVSNSGLIKADIAVVIAGKLVNSGTIEGIVAISAFDLFDLTNEASGIVRGDIYATTRDDLIRNAGQFFGNVDLDMGHDRFETSGAGIVTGVVNLGLGNDYYLGSTGLDRVAGDNDRDEIHGVGGNDLLLGGNAEDLIIGGDGNDGLFGERGNDVLRTSGGDYVDGGLNDDRIELGDYGFEFVGGGAGTDTLVLANGSRILDLSAAVASGRIQGFEIVELRGSQQIVVRAADVATLADVDDSLRIVATATDLVDLIGAWSALGTVSIGGADFAKYTLDGQTVLISNAASVQVLPSPPPGAIGLDAIAAGVAALRPGVASGIDFTPDVMRVTYLEIIEPTTLYEGETWFTEGKSPAVYSRIDFARLDIKGTLEATNTLQATAIAIDFDYLTSVVNDGTINVYSVGAVETPGSDRNPSSWEGAFGMQGGVSMVNRGRIDVYSLYGPAVGLGQPKIYRQYVEERWTLAPEYSEVVGFVENSGQIHVLAEGLYAVAAAGYDFKNSGDVLAVGKLGALAITAHDLVNSGTIEASVIDGLNGLVGGRYYESVAVVLLPSDRGYEVNNSGRIAADVALEVLEMRGTNPNAQPLHLVNSGTIEGKIYLLYADDVINNDGVIAGDLRLGGGVDQFDGSGGTQTGIVFGEDGDDRLIGGAGADSFAGGAGVDDLNGNGGADRFIYQAFTDSTSTALDRIRNFQSGIDKIDLTALGRLQLSWSAQTDASDGSVWQLVSAVGTGRTLSIRVDGSLARSDFIDQNAGTTIHGTGGDDLVEGGDGGDALYLQHGGNDRVVGHDGADGIYFGGALTGLDVVDGGPGTDTLALQGVYADLLLGDIRDIEVLLTLSGSDARFGNATADPAQYGITSANGNVAAGAKLTVQATGLLGGESLNFNGAAETDGHFRIFAGRGADTLTGGAGNDGFFFGADGNLTAADRIHGGSGTDSLALRGNYVGATAVLFDEQSFTSIEVLTFLSGHTNEFGGTINPDGFRYEVTLANGNVVANQRLDIIATNLWGTESLRFDARAETDGSVRILAGAANDRFWGSSNADIFYGGLGSDVIDGGAGADVYIYRAVEESAPAGRDNLFFTTGDKLDLAMIDAVRDTASNDAFTFIGSNVSFSYAAGQLRFLANGNQTVVEGDVNGDGVGDLYIFVTSTEPLTIADIIF